MSCWSLVRKDTVTDTLWDRREKEGHRPGDLGIEICVGAGEGQGTGRFGLVTTMLWYPTYTQIPGSQLSQPSPFYKSQFGCQKGQTLCFALVPFFPSRQVIESRTSPFQGLIETQKHPSFPASVSWSWPSSSLLSLSHGRP